MLISNRLGLSSIALGFTTAAADAAEVAKPILDSTIMFTMTGADIALVISSVGGVLFIVEKAIAIYLKYQHVKRLRLAHKVVRPVEHTEEKEDPGKE